jgi:hypothetical protein
MTAGETVIYKGITTCNVNKQLELQQRILDPSLAPENNEQNQQKLIARSAAKQIEKKLTAEQCIELQKKIIDSGY